MRLFQSKMNSIRSTLQTSIEWHSNVSKELRNKIIHVFLSSFLDVYSACSENDLGLSDNLTKKEWLLSIIKGELNKVKKGEYYLATISLNDNICGVLICSSSIARKKDLRVDIGIEQIAVKPFYDIFSKNRIRLSLGKQLIDSIEKKFKFINSIVLDTRRINHNARMFYEKLGFRANETTFCRSNIDYYIGYEKEIILEPDELETNSKSYKI